MRVQTVIVSRFEARGFSPTQIRSPMFIKKLFGGVFSTTLANKSGELVSKTLCRRVLLLRQVLGRSARQSHKFFGQTGVVIRVDKVVQGICQLTDAQSKSFYGEFFLPLTIGNMTNCEIRRNYPRM